MNKTLKTTLSHTPSIKNLANEEYLNLLLDRCDTLEDRFARIDSNRAAAELKKARKNPGRLPVGLKKMIREPVLPQSWDCYLDVQQG